MASRVKRSAHSATAAPCTRFEIHPYKRTPQCKNCSRTAEQHGRQGGEKEEEMKHLDESHMEKSVPEQDIAEGKCAENGRTPVSSPKCERTSTERTNGKPANEVRSSKGQPTSAIQVKDGRVRKCHNPSPTKATLDKVRSKVQVTDSKGKGQCTAADSKARPNTGSTIQDEKLSSQSRANGRAANEVNQAETLPSQARANGRAANEVSQAETLPSPARANGRAVNEVRPKTGQASKKRTAPKSRDTGTVATRSDEKQRTEVTRGLSSPSDFEMDGGVPPTFSSSSSSLPSAFFCSTSSTLTQTLPQAMDLDHASLSRSSCSLDSTSGLAETESETGSATVTCTTGNAGTGSLENVGVESSTGNIKRVHERPVESPGILNSESYKTLNSETSETLNNDSSGTLNSALSGTSNDESPNLDLVHPAGNQKGVALHVPWGVRGKYREGPIQYKDRKASTEHREGIGTKAPIEAINGNPRQIGKRKTKDVDEDMKGEIEGGIDGGIDEKERRGGGVGRKREGEVMTGEGERQIGEGGVMEISKGENMRELIRDVKGGGGIVRGGLRGVEIGKTMKRETDESRGGIEEGGGGGLMRVRYKREEPDGAGDERKTEAQGDTKKAADTEAEQQRPLPHPPVSISRSPEKNYARPNPASSACPSISTNISSYERDADKKTNQAIIHPAPYLRHRPAAQQDQSSNGRHGPSAASSQPQSPSVGAANRCQAEEELVEDEATNNDSVPSLIGTKVEQREQAEVEQAELVRPEVTRPEVVELTEVKLSEAERSGVKSPEAETPDVRREGVVGNGRTSTSGDNRAVEVDRCSVEDAVLLVCCADATQPMQQQQHHQQPELGRVRGVQLFERSTQDGALRSNSAGSCVSIFDVERTEQVCDVARKLELPQLSDNGIEAVAVATVLPASHPASPFPASAAEAGDEDRSAARGEEEEGEEREIRSGHIPVQSSGEDSDGCYANEMLSSSSNCDENNWELTSGSSIQDGDGKMEDGWRPNNFRVEYKDDDEEEAKDGDSATGEDEDDDELRSNLRRIANRFLGNGGRCVNADAESRRSSDEARRASIDGACMEKLMEKIRELEHILEKLNREKSALADLMGVKNTELQEERHHYRSKIQDLEDETLRLRAEKARLLKLFQLPESDRVSMSALENELEEMRKKLSDGDSRHSQIVGENEELRHEIKDLELEMQELHDQFQQEESAELRELRKELENTSRDIRLLHFKLRKSERKSDELRMDCDDQREKVRKLEERGKGVEEERRKMRKLEEEIRTAKEVSIRMHDECQRMQREQRSMTKELDGLRRGSGTKGEPRLTSSLNDVRTGSLNRPSLTQQSFDSGSSSLLEMLEKVAEAAKKTTSEVDDTGNCLRICHELERHLRDKLSCCRICSEPDMPTAVAEDANGMLGRGAGLDNASGKKAGKAEDEEERQERENELRLQLALADEESKILRRKLTEMRADNENLMRAVEYLRKKLEQRDASNSPPTKHKDKVSAAGSTEDAGVRSASKNIENNHQLESNGDSSEVQKRDVLANGCGDGRYTENSRAFVGYEDDERRKRSEEDSDLEKLRSNERGVGMKAKTPSTSSEEEERQNRDGGGVGRRVREEDESLVNKWKNRTMELQNEIVLLTEELQTTMEENERLTKDVTSSRRELENMLETLRRKERQFAEERKVLRRRNNDLSKMFDLLTERARIRGRSMKDGRGRGSEEEDEEEEEEGEVEKEKKKKNRMTQTERSDSNCTDEIYPRSELDSLDKQKATMDKVKIDLELDLKAKDEIIRSREEVIKRKDFLLGRAVKSLQDLEASVEEKMTIATEKDEELKKMGKEWKSCRDRVEALEKDLRKAEEKLKTSEIALTERQATLEKTKEKVSSLEAEVQLVRTRSKALEESLKVKDSELRSVRAEEQRMKAELDRVKVNIQEVEMDRDGLMREKKKLFADVSNERERLEEERRLEKNERMEMESNWKREEDIFKAEREEWKTKLKLVEEKLKKSMTIGWTNGRDVEKVELEKMTRETQTLPMNSMEKPLLMTSTVYTSVAKANVIHIPVLHEMSSSSPASVSISSSESTAAASTLTATATGAPGSADTSGFHGDADARVGRGRDLKVHCTQQLFRTTEELNPVAAVDLSSGQSRSRFLAWSSSTDHRAQRSGRTASVDRYGPTHVVPVSRVDEFVSNQSLLTDSSGGRQMVLLGRSGNRTPTAETCRARASPLSGSDVEWSREHRSNNRELDFTASGAGEANVLCIVPSSQPQELESESADVVAQATPKFRRHDRKQADASDSPAEFRRRSRSMSEFDIFSAGDADLFCVAQPPQPTEVTSSPSSSAIPQSASSISRVPLSSATAAVMPPLPESSPVQSITTGVVLRQKRTTGNGSGVRTSFYASGTMSACGSRETSPVRFVPQKRSTPYPVPPPSMIISPAKSAMGAPSPDRSGRIFSKGDVELISERLKDVDRNVSRDGLNSTKVNVGTQKDVVQLEEARSLLNSKVELESNLERCGVVVYAPLETAGFIRSSEFYHSWNRTKLDRVDKKGKAEKRSLSVSPRTARRKFFDEYPYDPPPRNEKWQRWRRNDAIPDKQPDDEVKKGEAGKDVGDQRDAPSAAVGHDSGIPRMVETRSRRIGLLNFSTLPFFRRKSPNRSDQLQKSQSEDLRDPPVSASTTSVDAPKSSSATRSRLHLPRFSTPSSRNPASTPTTPSPVTETRDQESHSTAPRYISGQSSLHAGSLFPSSKGGLRRDAKDSKEQEQSKYPKRTQAPAEPRETKNLKETKEPKKSQEPRKSQEQRRSVGPKESFEPVKPKLESKSSDPGLQAVQVSSSSNLYYDDQHSNSLKFQRIMKPFRKLGMGGGVGAGSGGVAGGGGGGSGGRPSKPAERLSFPTFHTLSESTMRSISLSSDLMKELSAGYGQLKVDPRTKSDDEAAEESQGEEGIRSKSLSASRANKIAPDDRVTYRSLDRKKKSYF